ncbi:MAG: hypothetical protein JNL72_06045 [Flavipsychrobacter sp.]|nr:hypothetical protein [Flavipsychrobacter sp.]
MEQPRELYIRLVTEMAEHLKKSLKILETIQSNENFEDDDELIAEYEKEKEEVERLSTEIKNVRKEIMN